MTPKEFFEFAKKNGAEMMDLKFVDMLGTWQHCSYPIATIDESIFTDGLGFDGSSIRGWQEIHQSDMLAVCDPNTAVIDPFYAKPTISVIANIVDPETKELYGKCPRNTAAKAAEYLKKTGIADTCFIGPEPEFFIFDEVRYEQNQHTGYYQIDSVEGSWNTARFEEPNLGYKPSYKGGYFPVSPTDTYHDLRGEMVYEMMKLGIRIEAHHHEVATAGQSEIDMEFCEMTKMCDQYMWYKYAIKNVAKKNGKTVTFMPKPVFDDNGSGMHSHISLWKKGDTIMAGDGYAGMSEIALKGIAGILKHAPAILAFGAPSTNSYRRLVPGFEAPVNLCLSARNRSASCRIPMYSNSPKAKRVEFRCPDPTANGYLLWPAMLMAMIDGIESDLPAPKPLDKNIYELKGEELASIPKVPGSLAESIDALEADCEFLTKGGVFSEELIGSWINWKRSEEIDPMALRPHPYEFHLYYDC
ncbi:MAG: type I glutamate--ammonia ligase [Phycisphaerae bacterium]|nr:type I glutamate--ammonia ligase [Phycisphaerae bacterium]